MTKTYTSYKQLKRPSWAPPAYLFGPVWSVLYLIILGSFGTVFYQAYQGVLPLFVIVPFVLNLVFNIAFTPIQFGFKSNILAAVDIALTWVTLAWLLIIVFPYIPWVTYANIPYFAWVSFATVLQFTITYLNRK